MTTTLADTAGTMTLRKTPVPELTRGSVYKQGFAPVIVPAVSARYGQRHAPASRIADREAVKAKRDAVLPR